MSRPWAPGWASKLLEGYHAMSTRELLFKASDEHWNPESVRSDALAAGDDPETVEALYKFQSTLVENLDLVGTFEIEGWLADARAPDHHADLVDLETINIVHAPQWQTGIESLDELTGGCASMTVFAGSAKQGKSMAALGAAVTAADTGWKVVYVNAELTPSEIKERILRFCDDNVPSTVWENLSLIDTSSGCTLDHVHLLISQTIGLEGMDKLLIVFDSINRLVEYDVTESGGGYFEQLRKWSAWPMLACKLSNGKVSFLVVSELNKAQTVKGGGLDYSANMLIRFTSVDDQPDNVNIDVQYSRSTASGPLGKHHRDWKRGRFDSVELGTAVRLNGDLY